MVGVRLVRTISKSQDAETVVGVRFVRTIRLGQDAKTVVGLRFVRTIRLGQNAVNVPNVTYSCVIIVQCYQLAVYQDIVGG